MKVLRRQGGFTMVETLVAVMMLALGALAVLSIFDSSRRTTFRAEQSQAISNVAQRELEEIRALDYDQIALTGMPSHSTSANHPGNRVSTANSTFDLNAAEPVENADLVVNGGSLEDGGQVAGGQVGATESFTTGDISGDIHRYVVWRDDPKCLISVSCAGSQDFKRVIVAVTVDSTAAAGFDRAYHEFQTDIIDPEASALTSDPAGGGVPTTAQQFWLSDQSCESGSGEPAAANPSGDHNTNNTTGSCGGTARPDALISEAPPDPDPNDSANPPQYDYAAEIEPGTGADQDKGLQMLRQSSNGCSSSVLDPQRIHWWDTRRLQTGTGGAFVMSGSSTLELWTRTINDVPVPGAICVYLRQRPIEVFFISTPVSIPIVNISSPSSGFSCSLATGGSGSCSTTAWPSGSWQKLRINLQTAPSLSLGVDNRLEIGISVERAGTPQDALQFLYDHPTFDSRWEIITTTPL